jgi:hypothetical protein
MMLKEAKAAPKTMASEFELSLVVQSEGIFSSRLGVNTVVGERIARLSFKSCH